MTPAGDLNEDERVALSLVPAAKEVMAFVRARLPEGTHFGVLVLTPGQPETGRVLAMTTDRRTVALGAARWVVDVLGPTAERTGTGIEATCVPATVCVHILNHGMPLCAFTAAAPCDWPAGHFWISLDQHRADRSAQARSCGPCLAVLAALGPDELPRG